MRGILKFRLSALRLSNPALHVIFHIVNLTKYHPPIRRLQEDFAARIARRRYTAARGPRPPKGNIMDNSEPWLANPNSVSDDWYIACKVNERIAAWALRQTLSSAS